MRKRDKDIFKAAGCGLVVGAEVFAAAWQFTSWPIESVIFAAAAGYLAGACAMLDLRDRRRRARKRLKIDPEMSNLTWMLDESAVLDKRIEACRMMLHHSALQRVKGAERMKLMQELHIW